MLTRSLLCVIGCLRRLRVVLGRLVIGTLERFELGLDFGVLAFWTGPRLRDCALAGGGGSLADGFLPKLRIGIELGGKRLGFLEGLGGLLAAGCGMFHGWLQGLRLYACRGQQAQQNV